MTATQTLQDNQIAGLEQSQPALLDDWRDFDLPHELEAASPPEARGLERDAVRLMVSYQGESIIEHATFRCLPDYLHPGDLLVINTSKTLKAALHAFRSSGQQLEVHLSTHLPADVWVVELRLPGPTGTEPFAQASSGETLRLPGGGWMNLLAPYRPEHRGREGKSGERIRLWLATLELPEPWQNYLERYGFPIRYKYVPQRWPIDAYQTVYATHPGSAEMPSAGRAFTAQLITDLVAGGVRIAPLVLHTGVASLEQDEPPYEEYFHVPAATARAVNDTRSAGGRVLAVGTTVVRALESAVGEDRLAHPAQGWTDLVVTPARRLHSVDGLLTGLHAPRSSHLQMLLALASEAHLRRAYEAALAGNYLWHEFGDLHLILPGCSPGR